MNLRGLANQYIQSVNPNTVIMWRKSTGYTKNENFEQVPAYEDAQIEAQIQGVSSGDLRHTDAMNMQGVMRKVYMYGNPQGVATADAKGGDLLIFPQVPGGASQKWLITSVLETWPAWAAVIVVLQDDNDN